MVKSRVQVCEEPGPQTSTPGPRVFEPMLVGGRLLLWVRPVAADRSVLAGEVASVLVVGSVPVAGRGSGHRGRNRPANRDGPVWRDHDISEETLLWSHVMQCPATGRADFPQVVPGTRRRWISRSRCLRKKLGPEKGAHAIRAKERRAPFSVQVAPRPGRPTSRADTPRDGMPRERRRRTAPPRLRSS